MKNLKKLLILALVAIMAISMVACGTEGEGEETLGNQAANQQQQETPRPTPKPTVVDVSATQANNYYVAFTVLKSGEIVEDENGNMVEKVEPDKYVEIGFSGVTLISKDGGESFSSVNSNCFASTADIATNPNSVFSVHMNYQKDQLEDMGTEVVAGKECKHYFFKNGRMEYHMYVDESFGTTGMCLKFVSEGYKPQTIEVTELKFDVINKEDGYNFVDFQMKIATPKPAEEAPAA